MTTRRPNRADDIRRLRLLQSYCERVPSLVEGHERSDLDDDWEFQLASCKVIELIGHDVGRLSADARELATELDWPRIVGMRNVLAHAYEDADHDKMWEALTVDIPELLPHLQRMLDELETVEAEESGGQDES